MDEASGQVPHEPTKKILDPKRPIDWDAGFALYSQGKSAGIIGRALGVRRETVQRHIVAEDWKAKRERARALVTDPIPLTPKNSPANEFVALELDSVAQRVVKLVDKRLTEFESADIPPSADQLQKLTYALGRAGILRRQSRGMAPNEGFAPREDRMLVVQIQRLPATKAEYDASKTPTEPVPA